MKLQTFGAMLAGAVMAAMSFAATAQAANHPLVTVGEAGFGSGDFCAPGCPVAMPGTLQADPGPGGLSSALTYNLQGPPSVTSGDLLIYLNGVLDDVVRFNDAGTGSAGYPASLVFYSAVGGGALADTGFPGSFYANTVSVNEVHGKVLYNPTSGQPGFVPTFNAAYAISSAPEPGAWAMLLIGLGGLGALARTRRQRPAEA